MHIHIHTPDLESRACAIDEFGIEALGGPADAKQMITVGEASFTGLKVDCVVGGGNAFGFLDGADYPLAKFFGHGLQERVHEDLGTARATFAEVFIGTGLLVATTSRTIPWLIWAPYARQPMPIVDPISVMLAARAAVFVASRSDIERLWLPMMGVGSPYGLHPVVAARAMRSGIRMGLIGRSPRPINWRDGLFMHNSLVG